MNVVRQEVLERPGASAWRPSEYTGFLLHALQGAVAGRRLGSVVEIGVGSGVVLASLAQLGATVLAGTDVDAGALKETRRLLDHMGHAAELLQGDLWAPLAGRRFDLIVANPPHFPMLAPGYAGRPPDWSFGGPDGRRVMDPLLRGLRRHLGEGGRAIVVHSAFLGRDTTARALAAQGMRARCLASSLMPLAAEKQPVMTPAVLHGAEDGAIQRIGPHVFLLTEVLEIGADG